MWIASGAPDLVIRAHRPWRPDATYPISGLSALTAAAGQRSEDPLRDVEDNLAWVHRFLTRLAGRVAVPSPLRLFRFGGIVWEALSFVPGEVIGDRPGPSLAAVGAFLARYHEESARLDVDPRPQSTPVDGLSSVVDWSQGAATVVPRTMLDRLSNDLVSVGHAALPRAVVHGDPTTHNVLATGAPPQPCGLIDFDLAYHDAIAADIAFGVWRSGRPAPTDHRIDPRRLAQFVAGYCTVRPLSAEECAAIPVYLRARGLQMLVKRTRLGIADNGPLEQVRWIEANQEALRLAAAG